MRIRAATDFDLPSIAALHIESCMDAYSHVFPAEFLNKRLPENLRRHWNSVEMTSEDLVLIAEDQAPIGFVAVWCRPSPFIDNLHVHPAQRSRGAGSALLAAAAERLTGRGHKSAYLWVFESNIGAIRLYRRLGGVVQERAARSVFGNDVMSLRIEWHDLAAIADSVR